MCIFCQLSTITKDFTDIEDFSITKDFQLLDQKWGDSQSLGSPGNSVSFGFAERNIPDQLGSFDSFITDKDFQAEIVSALSAWEDVADIRFVLAEDSDNADIRFGWENIDGPRGILGQTNLPSAGGLKIVTVMLDVDEEWFLGGDAPTNKIDFSSTVTHEIGHAIGIDHSQSKNALMNAAYSRTIFDLQSDDINAATAIYGENEIVQLDINRFYNPNLGGHFFTADLAEKISVDSMSSFLSEGVGFRALSRNDENVHASTPVYRFYNPNLGSHFFTAFEEEKNHVLELENFIFEGIGFRAFDTDSSATIPIYRFFNVETGGHFFTASKLEMEAVLIIPNFRYEGEAFFAFT